MPLAYSKNKKHCYKWVENNRAEWNAYIKKRYNPDKRREKYAIQKSVMLLKVLPFFKCELIEL